MTALLQQFLAESQELLDGICAQVLLLEKDASDAVTVNELFRLVHTLKGNSGLFDLPAMTRVLHAAEDVLSRVRDGAAPCTPLLANLLLETSDLVARICDQLARGLPTDAATAQAGVELAARLRSQIAPATAAATESARAVAFPAHPCGAPPALPEVAVQLALQALAAGTPVHWLCYRPDEQCFFQGQDPFLQVRELPGLLWGVARAVDGPGSLDSYDPYRAILEFNLLSSASTEELTEHFRYVLDQVSIQPFPVPGSATAGPVPGQPDGEAATSFGRRREDAAGSRVLKVDAGRVDRLMNLIGEFIVSKNALPFLARRAEEQFRCRELGREIKDQYTVLERIADEMQDCIMQLRMLPFSFVSGRFGRLVRDVSQRLGKDVDLVIEGEDTEADKNVIDALADPLVHVVRNSLDHGLEAPEDRLAAGKPQRGTLRIRAAQEGDQFIVEVSDDGRGIDPNAIRRSAVGKGLLSATDAEALTDREAIHLIFTPGFSTASEVSELSGRGVGMDAVRSAVERLGGRLELASEVSRGTTLRLLLPLSMAVTQVMIVEADRQLFGVPTAQVVETVRIPRQSVQSLKRRQATLLRDRLVPLCPLHDMLGLGADPAVNEHDELALLVTRVGANEVGVVVDDFHSCQGIIQKPMTGILGGVTGYTGSALLGDGTVLMVLNLPELVS